MKKKGIIMSFSTFLDSRRSAAKELVAQLKKHFAYVSVLGVDVLRYTIFCCF